MRLVEVPMMVVRPPMVAAYEMLRDRHLQTIWSWWDLYFLLSSWFLGPGVRTAGFSYQRKIRASLQPSSGCPAHKA